MTWVNPILCSTAFFLTLILHSLTHSRFQLSHILVFSHTDHLFHTLTPLTLSHSFFLPTSFSHSSFSSSFLTHYLIHTLFHSLLLSVLAEFLSPDWMSLLLTNSLSHNFLILFSLTHTPSLTQNVPLSRIPNPFLTHTFSLTPLFFNPLPHSLSLSRLPHSLSTLIHNTLCFLFPLTDSLSFSLLVYQILLSLTHLPHSLSLLLSNPTPSSLFLPHPTLSHFPRLPPFSLTLFTLIQPTLHLTPYHTLPPPSPTGLLPNSFSH